MNLRISRAQSIWAFLLAVVMGAPAFAAQPEDCPTFFPDFRCDRSGRYEGFIRPMTAPFLFEDPFITTGVYAYGVWHDIPRKSIFKGGEAYVLAVQARVAITDRLAFIATKDGYAWFRPGEPLLRDDNGWLDISAGLKYALIDRPEDNFILSPSLRIDVPTGSEDLFSGNGEGVAIPAVSTAWGYGNFHVIADVGGRIPFDMGAESTSLFYNVHFDYAVHENFVPFVSFNGYHYFSGGDGKLKIDTKDFADLALDTAQTALATGHEEGLDVWNIGSKGVAGQHIATFAIGFQVPITKHVSGGMAYEVPISNRKDVINHRATLNLNFEL